MGRKIRITESKLKQIISESVKRILKENSSLGEEQKALRFVQMVKSKLDNNDYDYEIDYDTLCLTIFNEYTEDEYILYFPFDGECHETGDNIETPHEIYAEFNWKTIVPVKLEFKNKETILNKNLSDKLYDLISKYSIFDDYIEEKIIEDYQNYEPMEPYDEGR
jgi:hypothetical protein